MSSPLALKIEIRADGSAAVTDLRKVEVAVKGVGGAAQQADSGLSVMAATAAKLGAGLVGLEVARRVVGIFMDVNAEAGKLRASLVTVTGSVPAAADAWKSLTEFAAQTPYDLSQAVQGFTKLKALGLDPSIAALRSYGNTASAMGKDLNQMIEAVADASVGEFERLKEFGIKASSEGGKVTLTFRGVATTIDKDAAAIEGYLRRLGDVEFAGAMTRQMDTIGGALSNLSDASTKFWTALGDTGLARVAKAVLQDAAASLDAVTAAMARATPTAPESLGMADRQAEILKTQAGLVDQIAAAEERLAQARARQGLSFQPDRHSAAVQEAADHLDGLKRQYETLGKAAAEAGLRMQDAFNAETVAAWEKLGSADRAATEKAFADAAISRSAAMAAFGDQETQRLQELLPTITAAAKQYGVAKELIIAVMAQESQFRKNAVSPKGAQGLMQIMPDTAGDIAGMLGVSKDKVLTDWETNIQGGVRYIKWLGEQGVTTVDGILAAYNAGLGNYKKGTAMQFAETRGYVSTVKADMDKLGGAGKSLSDILGKNAADARSAQSMADRTLATLAGMQGKIAGINARARQESAEVAAQEGVDAQVRADALAAIEAKRAADVLAVRQGIDAKTLGLTKSTLAEEKRLRVEAAQAIAQIEADKDLAAGDRAARINAVNAALAQDLAKHAAAAAAQTVDLWKGTMDEEVRIRVAAAQKINAIQAEVGLPEADRASRISAVLAALDQDVAKLNGTAALTPAALEGIAEQYGSGAMAAKTYAAQVAAVGQAHKDKLMNAEEYRRAIEQIGLTYEKTQGPWRAYIAGLKENLGTLESFGTDVFDHLRTSLVDSLASGKASFADFVDYAKKRLIEIAVNTIVVNLVGNVSTASAGQTATGAAVSAAGGSGGIGGLGNLSSLGNMFGGNSIGANMLGGVVRASNFTGTTMSPGFASGLGVAGALPNWAFGAAGIAGGLGGQLLFPNSPYSGLGGSLGATAGMFAAPVIAGSMGMAATGAMMGSVVPIVGTIIGGLAGTALGSLLGGGNDKKKAERKAREAAEAQARAQATASLDAFNAKFATMSALVPDGVKHVVAMTGAFSQMGAVMPRSRSEYQALVNAQDLGSESGRALAGALMEMADGMEAMFASIEQNRKIFDLQFKGVGETGMSGQISLLRQAVGETMRAVNSIGDDRHTAFAVPQSRTEYVRNTESLLNVADRLGPIHGAYSRMRYAALLAGAEQVDAYFDAIEALAAERKQTTRGLQDMFRTPAQIARVDASEARAEALRLGKGVIGFDPKGKSKDDFEAAIKAAGGAAALVAKLGDKSAGYLAAMTEYFDQTEAAADATNALTDSLRDWVAETRRASAALSKPAQIEMARAQYSTQLAAARAGDEDAIRGLTSYADAYLAAAQEQSRTALEYAAVLGRVTADVARVAGPQTPGYAEGGIASGPASGYPVTLHGTEAVIPLSGGAVPVSISYADLIAEIKALRADVRALGIEQIRHGQKVASTLTRWESDGMPEARA